MLKKSTYSFYFVVAVLAFLLYAGGAFGQVPSYVPTNGLVGWWPFNGNANDESGNGNDGTVNGATMALDRFGFENRSYSFDGSSSYITGQQNTVFETLPLSFSFWFTKVGSGNTCLYNGQLFEANMSVFSIGNYLHSYDIMLHSQDDKIGIQRSSPPSNLPETDLYVSAPYALGIWNHCVVTFSEGEVQLFLNGVFQGAISYTLPTSLSSTNWFIGKSNPTIWSCVAYMNGSLDDIGIWNRALTADEVLALYNGCNVMPFTVSGNVTPTQFTEEIYTYPSTLGSTYNWSVTNGVILSGQGTNSVAVMWANSGTGSIGVTETNSTGCVGDTVNYNVVIIPTHVEELSNAINLYPNPATTSITLQVNSNMVGKDYIVYDSVGQLILKNKITSTQVSINTNELANGNYILRVESVDKVFTISK